MHETLEVRKRLGDGETALRRGKFRRAEDGKRDVIAGPGLGAECGPCLLEPPRVVRDQLTRAAGRIPNRFAVTGIDEARR